MRELFKWDSGGGGSGGAASILRSIIAGLGLFGGGDLSDDITINVGEGPGIDVTEDAVGLGGDTILLYDSGGNPCAEFAPTDSGLGSALSAMGAGDVAELPDITISGGPWTISNGTLRGHSRFGSILDGELTIFGNAERLSVIRSEDDADPIYGVILAEDAKVDGCYILITNASGDVIAVYSSEDTGGDAHSIDNFVYGISVSGDGYAFGTDGANIYVSGGRGVGSTAPVRT